MQQFTGMHWLMLALGGGLGFYFGFDNRPNPEPAPECPEPERKPTGTPPTLGRAEVKTWPSLARSGEPALDAPRNALVNWQILVQAEGSREEFSPISNDGVRLQMPSGTSWQCVVMPLTVEPTGPSGPKPKFWILSREVRCSNDGWASQVTSSHSAFAYANGDVDNPADQLNLELSAPGEKAISVILMPHANNTDARARMVFLPPDVKLP